MEAFFIPIWNPNLISLINRHWSAYQGLLLIYSSKPPIFMMQLQKRWREIVRGVEPISVLPVSALLLLTVIWCMRSEMKVLGYKHGGSVSDMWVIWCLFVDADLFWIITAGFTFHSAHYVREDNAPPFCFLNISNYKQECLHFITGLQQFSKTLISNLHYSLLCYLAVHLTVTLSPFMEPQNRPNNDVTL